MISDELIQNKLCYDRVRILQCPVAMCLILFSFEPKTDTPLILAANRDEFFDRPTRPAQFWPEHPHVLAGKDLTAGGTWLGMTRSGRFAAITNVREPNVAVENPLSRGLLTLNYLTGNMAPQAYLESISPEQERYPGFNLLVGEFTQKNSALYYFSNRKGEIESLSPGTYGLSNHLLNTPWPKVKSGTSHLRQIADPLDHGQLRQIIENPTLADDEDLPKTGVSYEREKMLSASFIISPDYGTRCSSVITINAGEVAFSEQGYHPSQNGRPAREGEPSYIQYPMES